MREERLLPSGWRRGSVYATRSNETALKLWRFEVNERQQTVAEIESMIVDFKRLVDDLSHQIEAEEETSRIRDVNHFSYPTFAKAARQRRDNLLSSITDLEAKLEEATAALDEAREELRKSQMVEERSHVEMDRTGLRPINGHEPGEPIDEAHAVGGRA
jgi:chromosome segregation ATPase